MSNDKKDTAFMEKLVSLCKRRGFIYQSSEIYGGIGGFWDYGPLGSELKRNLRDAWWKAMMRDREDVVGLDATIIMHPAIWKASGHVDTFTDMMVECPITNKRLRADHVDPSSGIAYTFEGAQEAPGKIKIAVEEWKGKGFKPFFQFDSTTDNEFYLLSEFRGHLQEMKVVADLAMSNAAKDALAKLPASIDCNEPFTVLVPDGKPQQSADKVAFSFYKKRGLVEPVLKGFTKSKVDNSKLFNPENGAQLTEPRPFNLMFRSHYGPIESDDNICYLRPETAQAIFAQFKNVFDSSRVKVPFGIGQIGKAFRNEVTPKNFTFRSREFEQMELEFFIKPDEAVEIICGNVAQWSKEADLSAPQPNWGWEMWHRYWVAQRTKFYQSIGLGADVLEYFEQPKEDLAHYARACVDILFKFPFGTDELEGIAARGDFDLSQHQKHSGKNLEVFDDELKAAAVKLSDEQKEAMIQKRLAAEKAKTKGAMPESEVRAWFERLFKGNYLPHVIEPSAGLDRLALAVLAHALEEIEKVDDKGKKEIITVMHIHPRIAPVKVGVFPLVKNKPEIVGKAREVYELLKKHLNCFWDEVGSIGRRYARQDEAGTPFGVTIDFDTLGEKGPELLDTVTVRERDSQKQERIAIKDLLAYLLGKIG